MIVNIVKARYINHFIINFSFQLIHKDFTEEVKKSIDLESYIKSKKDDGVFLPLKNIDYFKNFHLNANTIEWNNGVDIAPERLLEIDSL